MLGMGKFYAVFKGRKPGIYMSWNECKVQVNGFSGAIFKSFNTEQEARDFLRMGHGAKSNSAENSGRINIPSLKQNSERPKEAQTGKGTKRKADTSAERNHAKSLKLQGVDDKKVMINNFTFIVDENDYPVVFTDGACSNNGKQSSKVRAGYGVFWGDKHPLNLSKRLDGIQTNQRAEIAAIIACLKQAKTHSLDNLTIKTDSQFVINCVTKWVPRWVKNNWMKSDGKPVIHKNELIMILDYLKHIKVNWVHVRGHRGIYGNEMADRLAVAGSLLHPS